MTSENIPALLGKLDELHGELVELAFVLDQQGRHEAADVATTVGARLSELRDEFWGGLPVNLSPTVRNDPVCSLN